MEDTLQRYLDRIRQVYRHRSGEELAVEETVLNQEGLVNDVVIVDGKLVCRFGKHDWAPEDLRRESRCLALAARHVDLSVPQWTWHADDFVTYPLLPGIPLRRRHLFAADGATRERLARQLGTFLRRLHSIPLAEVEAAGIKLSVTNRSYEDWLRFYEAVRERLFPLLMASARQWVDDHFAPLLENPTFMDGEPCLIHGDLASYHLLYDPEARRLNGVLDFGTAGIGDPACDLAGVIGEYGESFLRDLNPYYPEIGKLIERARFWVGTLELQWLLGGLRNPDDPSWFAVHIGRARDAMPIGSGW